VDFRERVLVDGGAISEDEVLDWIERRSPAIESLGATFFEATTALAIEHFAAEEVDVVVLETGLGGRLDSTNVVTPLAATVTSIGMDHTDLLGDTIEAIAGEKAGIFKTGCPAVIGERDDHVASVLDAAAKERRASPVRRVEGEWAPREIAISSEGTAFVLGDQRRPTRLTTRLVGEHQAWNAATALLTLDTAGEEWRPTDEAVAKGLARVALPGRMQRVGQRIFDVAHNPAGARVLEQTLREIGAARPLVCVLAVLGDKDWRGIMTELSPVVDHFVLTTAPTAPADRTWNASLALEYARTHGWSAQLLTKFDDALAHADAAAGTVLITGSFHTVGDAMARLQVDPLAG
jgi:dihydrofolate synthase/folylpolyglutamate synthase